MRFAVNLLFTHNVPIIGTYMHHELNNDIENTLEILKNLGSYAVPGYSNY